MKIQGITIQLGADAEGVNSALQTVQTKLNKTSKELYKIEKQLKFDPSNTVLLAQKQELLAKQSETTKEKLSDLTDMLGKHEQKMRSADTVTEDMEAEHRALVREIEKSKNQIEGYDQKLEEMESGSKDVAEETDNLGDSVVEADKKTSTFAETLRANLTSQAIVKGVKVIVDGIVDIGRKSAEAIGECVNIYADFDDSMRQVAATMGLSADEMSEVGGEFDLLTQAAKDYGASTKFSASEAADAMNYMAMAGWKSKDMLAGIDGILSLAAASGADLATTSDIVTDALTAMGYGADEAGHLADVMAAASSNANTNVEMMGETFKYAAPVTGALGMSMEDTAIAVGLMANSGIKASQAGTALRTALTNMVKPTDQMASAMEKYGISVTDSEGNMKSLAEIMGMLREQLGDVSEAEQASAAAAIFGKDAMAGMLAIINASEADYDKLSAAVYGSSVNLDSFNQAAEEAKIPLDSMRSAFEKAGVSGEAFNSALSYAHGDAKLFVEGLDEACASGYRAGTILSELGITTTGLQTAMDNSTGAAKAMADTMESGLAGTERSWNSAMEGLKIQTGEIFAGVKKEALTNVTEIVRTLTTGLSETEGDWTKIGTVVGDAMGSALNIVSDYMPQFVGMAICMIDVLCEGMASNTDKIVSSASSVINVLLSGISSALPNIVAVAVPLLLALVDGIIGNLPMIVDAALQIIFTLCDGIAQALPTLVPQIVQVAIQIVNTLLDNVPLIIEAALAIVVALAEGISDALPELVAAIPQILSAVVTAINASLPLLLPAAIDIIFELISGLLKALPELYAFVPNLILGIVQGILDNLPTIILAAPEIIVALITGLMEAIPQLIMAVPRIIMSIVDTFREYDWNSVGTNLMEGLKDGIFGMKDKIVNKIREIANSIKKEFCDFFGIHSPSTVFAGFGENLLEGLWNGIANVKEWLMNKIRGLGSSIIGAVKDVFGIHSPSTVFRDTIGKNLMLGIAEGVDAETPNLLDTLNSDLTAVTTGLDFGVDMPVDAYIDTPVIAGCANFSQDSNTGYPGSAITVSLNIENFNNNCGEDINRLADELSTVLAAKMRRREVCFA